MGETLWRRLVRGVWRLHCQPRWAEFAGPDWAERIMGLPLGDRFHAKQGRTIARWTLDRDDRRRFHYPRRGYGQISDALAKVTGRVPGSAPSST